MVEGKGVGGSAKPASLFIFKDRIVWSSHGFRGEPTSRPTCALLVGAYKELSITLEDEHVFRSRALLIGPNVKRALDADGVGFYSLNLDPSHRVCGYLRREVLAGGEVVDVGPQLNAETISAVTWTVENSHTCADSRRISDEVVSQLFPDAANAPPPDPRVLRAADWLKTHLPSRTYLHELCEQCHLSEGRLTHLFSQELGVSIRSYLLWTKMQKAAEMFSQDLPLTDVAATIGFSDSAHLARVFRTYFSAAPSFLANRAQVCVQVCAVSPE